jgi:hypothetical protein
VRERFPDAAHLWDGYRIWKDRTIFTSDKACIHPADIAPSAVPFKYRRRALDKALSRHQENERAPARQICRGTPNEFANRFDLVSFGFVRASLY